MTQRIEDNEDDYEKITAGEIRPGDSIRVWCADHPTLALIVSVVRLSGECASRITSLRPRPEGIVVRTVQNYMLYVRLIRR